MIIWSVYLYIFCRLRTAIFVPRGKRSDWIFINVFFFLLIYRKRKFCTEPMRERLTFHFELRTRSVNFRFFFFSSFLSFCFFQIKARSRLVTVIMQIKIRLIWGLQWNDARHFHWNYKSKCDVFKLSHRVIFWLHDWYNVCIFMCLLHSYELEAEIKSGIEFVTTESFLTRK